MFRNSFPHYLQQESVLKVTVRLGDKAILGLISVRN